MRGGERSAPDWERSTGSAEETKEERKRQNGGHVEVRSNPTAEAHLRIDWRVGSRNEQRNSDSDETEQSHSPPDQARPAVAFLPAMESDIPRLAVEGRERPKVPVGSEREAKEEEEGKVRFDLTAAEREREG